MYTLQPVFRSLGQQFRCHVRRRLPDTMYRLWFYVTVLKSGFETPRVHREVTYRRGQRGRDQVTPFLSVDYSVGMTLDDELILTGRVDDDETWNYTVRPLVNRSRSQRSNVNQIYISPIVVGQI